jgi:hypothetical protein
VLEWIGYAALMSVYFYVGWRLGSLTSTAKRHEEAIKSIIEKHNALVRVLTGRDEE